MPASAFGNRISTGIAGEFFVAAELTKRGWIVTLTAKNTPAVDILGARMSGDVHARIQVKTRSPSYRRAHRVGKLKATDERDFVVLVDLGGTDEAPRYWVIPAQTAIELVVNDQIRTTDVEPRRALLGDEAAPVSRIGEERPEFADFSRVGSTTRTPQVCRDFGVVREWGPHD